MAYDSTGSGNVIGGNVTGSALSPSVSLVSVSFSLATAPRSPALISGTAVWRLALEQLQAAEPLGDVARLVVDRRVGLERAGHDAEHRDAAGERIGDGLPDERRHRAPCRRPRARRRRPSLPTAVNGRSAGDGSVRDDRHRAAAGRRCSASPTRTRAGTACRRASPRGGPPRAPRRSACRPRRTAPSAVSSASATISMSDFARVLDGRGHVGRDRAPP